MSKTKRIQSTRIIPKIAHNDKTKTYSLNIKVNGSFNNVYTIADFEELVAKGEFQEAYWAAYIIESYGVQLDYNMSKNVQDAVEKHWPSICEERK